jgi:HSP20 family protein
MTLIRWNPFGESVNRYDPYRTVGDIRSDVNRLLGSFLGPMASGTTTAAPWAPAVDMYATNDEMVVAVELPGVPDKEVHVSVAEGVLTIRGQRVQPDEAKDARPYWGERWFGAFERHVPLPFPVDAGKVKATFKDGVLTVTLPKAEALKTREIKVETF